MPTDSNQWGLPGKVGAILGVAIGIWLAWWYYVAVAASTEPPVKAPSVHSARMERTGLDSPEASVPPLDAMRTYLEQMSEQDMKRFYTRCSREGIERRLDGGEAMACSIGYDVLLKKHFAGDFDRFLAWSRSPQAAE